MKIEINECARVLVVDDVTDAAESLAMLLELDGYTVRIAGDGVQALAQIPGFAPHCILFDIEMPGIDGFAMSRQVREHYGDDIVLIAVTGREIQDPRVSGAFVVADHYLIKPVDPAVLRKLLPPLRPSSRVKA